MRPARLWCVGLVGLAGLMVGGPAARAQAAVVAQQKLEVLDRIPESVDGTDFSMSLGLGPCFGPCPVYAVTLMGDGTLKFNGGRNVLFSGRHVTHVSPDLARTLLEKFRQAGFTAARDEYGFNEDMPMAVTTVMVGQKVKSIMGDAPPEIRKASEDLRALAERWVIGNDEIGAVLAEEGWSFSAPTPENLGIYTKAILSRQTSVIEMFVAAGGPVASSDGQKLSPVCVASAMGETTLVHRMLASVSKADGGHSAARSMPADAKYECLAAAAASGDVSLFDFWLEQGPPMQVPPVGSPEAQARWEQWLPLQRAGGVPRWNPVKSFVANGMASDSLPMVRRMLDFRGAMPNDFQNWLRLALEAMDPKATDGHELQIVQLLLSAGATVTEGQLYVAAGYQGLERVAIIRLLLTHDVDKKDPAYSALAQAVRMGGPGAAETVRLLLDAGADLHKVNHVAGPTVLFDASCLPEPLQKQMDQSLYEEVPGVCAPEVVKPLVRRGLDLNAVNTDGYTALTHFAAREGMVRELLADGADPTIIGKDGRGAREIAETYGCAACVVLIDEAVKKRVPGGR